MEVWFSHVPSWDEPPPQACGEGVPTVALEIQSASRLVRVALLPVTWWRMFQCLRRDPPLGIGICFVSARLAWKLALCTTRAHSH